LAVAALQTIGIYLFVSGFLCTRQELSNIASCQDPQAACPAWLPCTASNTGPQGCNGGAKRTLPEFRFVVLLIVDALRFDFAPEFPTIANMLAHRRDQSRLFQFVADAPTTTMQRLKGLTTGGLPTFVDMGRSFDAGIDIHEDNWVHGAIRAGHRVSVTGDDTWVSLFPPHRLTKAQPYPSLNVKDIDGCDNHVINTLPRELAEAAQLPLKQRSVIVGHFLGVDHIGTQFTCYTSTKAKTLTPYALQGTALASSTPRCGAR
jgi:phosphatidylinositol glycan class O